MLYGLHVYACMFLKFTEFVFQIYKRVKKNFLSHLTREIKGSNSFFMAI